MDVVKGMKNFWNVYKDKMIENYSSAPWNNYRISLSYGEKVRRYDNSYRAILSYGVGGWVG